MNTIWKYPLQATLRQSIIMPAPAQLLSVQIQNGFPHLWALVPVEPIIMQPQEIICLGTGHEIDNVGRYLGTCQMMGGQLIYHFFEGA